VAYLHQRRTLRLPGRDYSRGTYLVTVCAIKDGPRFGEVSGDRMHLNDIGRAVAETWQWLPVQYPHVTLDEWILMPDPLHALIILADPRQPPSPGTSTRVSANRKPLGQLIGAFKTVSTRSVNGTRNTPGAVLWQRNFWERVVRNLDSLDRIRRYIRNNPAALAARSGARPVVGAAREPPLTQHPTHRDAD
jgi:REP element-mobilizing transposase RayT